MEQKKEVKLNLSIDDGGPGFFAHEISVEMNPSQAVLDFKNVTPRIDQRNQQGLKVMKMVHNAIIVEPLLLKEMSMILTNVVKAYEDKFGEITKSDATLKMEEEFKKEMEKIKKQQKDSTKPESVNYMG